MQWEETTPHTPHTPLARIISHSNRNIYADLPATLYHQVCIYGGPDNRNNSEHNGATLPVVSALSINHNLVMYTQIRNELSKKVVEYCRGWDSLHNFAFINPISRLLALQIVYHWKIYLGNVPFCDSLHSLPITSAKRSKKVKKKKKRRLMTNIIFPDGASRAALVQAFAW